MYRTAENYPITRSVTYKKSDIFFDGIHFSLGKNAKRKIMNFSFNENPAQSHGVPFYDLTLQYMPSRLNATCF
jgi:hypothetical protein